MWTIFCLSAINDTNTVDTLTAKILKQGIYLEKMKVWSVISLNFYFPTYTNVFWRFAKFATFSDVFLRFCWIISMILSHNIGAISHHQHCYCRNVKSLQNSIGTTSILQKKQKLHQKIREFKKKNMFKNQNLAHLWKIITGDVSAATTFFHLCAIGRRVH